MLLALLCGCSINTYTARVDAPGHIYTVKNHVGSLITVKMPDGTSVTSDDRKAPGILDKIISLYGLRMANGK